MTDIAGLLAKARDVIASPDNWLRHRLAIGADGRETDPSAPGARSWCAEGAMLKVCQNPSDMDRCSSYLTDAVQELYGTTEYVAVNDDPELGHYSIMQSFDRAIEMAKKEDNQ